MRSIAFAPLLVLASCASTEPTTPIVAPAPTTTASKPVLASPIEASFFDLGEMTVQSQAPCDVHFVAVASGEATAGDEKLGPGDVAVANGPTSFALRGKGVVLIASYAPAACAKPESKPMRVIRAAAAPELTWAKGAMHAHLDVEKEESEHVYFGRLAGTAPVAEHQHDGAWEVLCAFEASGTFVLAGKEEHLGARQCVAVPPSTRHSWKPDAGSTLVGFQLYTPPGPEQRFRTLAAGGK